MSERAQGSPHPSWKEEDDIAFRIKATRPPSAARGASTTAWKSMWCSPLIPRLSVLRASGHVQTRSNGDHQGLVLHRWSHADLITSKCTVRRMASAPLDCRRGLGICDNSRFGCCMLSCVPIGCGRSLCVHPVSSQRGRQWCDPLRSAIGVPSHLRHFRVQSHMF